MTTLVPDYLNVDFTTIVNRVKERLGSNATFRDYNYEGANFTILIELMAYLGELNTYYLNKIAKNTYIDTADIYENVNRLARYIGYEPKGYRSSKTTLTITVSGGGNYQNGDQLYIPAWKQFNSTETYEGEVIQFANTESTTTTVSTTGAHSFPLVVRQGVVTTFDDYRGRDLIDNDILLPTYNFAHNDTDDDPPIIEVSVQDENWTRISDFYDDISGLTDLDNVYMFLYDKYRRNRVSFNSARNVPDDYDTIDITMLRSLGEEGNVAANTITSTPETQLVYNITQGVWLSSTSVTSIANSGAATGGDGPEEIDIVKENAKSTLHAQFRNVTSLDYISHLQERSDVIIASAWGEQEVSPSGSTYDYNKVYLTVIPQVWTTTTIETTASTWTPYATSGATFGAASYNSIWSDAILDYLEPRKMLTAYEVFNLPDLVWFSFDVGVEIKRGYTYTDVIEDIRDKMIYWFRTENREFNEVIDFKDIHNYVIDTDETSDDDDFENVRGIKTLVIRDVITDHTLYEPNESNNYPQFTISSFAATFENRLRPIELGYDQFPMLASTTIRFRQEI